MPPIPNALLEALPRSACLRLEPALSPVTLRFRERLYQAGSRMEYVYFPLDAMVSLLAQVDDRPPLEVGLVGREGMVGVALALGEDVSPMTALVQGAGTALRMRRAPFLAALRDVPALRRGLNTYVHHLMQQITLTAACNQFHPVRARLARWLLMTRDRIGGDEYRMTHELLSWMLGVRRAGVTEAAAGLERGGLISYRRGLVRILDVAGLIGMSCSCYARMSP